MAILRPIGRICLWIGLVGLATVANGWHCPRSALSSRRQHAVSPTCRRSTTTQSTRATVPPLQASGSSTSANNNNNHHAQALADPRDVYLVSWEGCLVDTVPWRTRVGLELCRHVWPDLEVLISPNNNDKDDDEHDDDDDQQQQQQQWLYNKVRALHHVLILDPDYSPSVEYALLIRLLLEEQELDQGRSNGSRGKYGSKYHPSADNDTFVATAAGTAAGRSSESEPAFNKRRQRPLTVGEIAANWQDSLREAVLIRYYQEENKNPLDLLQQALDTGDVDATATAASKTRHRLSLQHIPEDVNVLRNSNHGGGGCSIVVTVPHVSDMAVVQETLQAINLCVCDNVKQAVAALPSSSSSSRRALDDYTLPLVCRTKDLVQESLKALPEGSSLYVMESSWPILKTNIPVFGDFVPRSHDRAQPCSIPTCNLQLALWRNAHPNDQAAALMNVWTVSREDVTWPTALQPMEAATSSQRQRR